MITNFKIFEDTNKETTFILDDLIDYYTDNKNNIKTAYITSFINGVFKYKVLVKFNCKSCYFYNSEGTLNHAHYSNGRIIHKGLIQGTGIGFYEHEKKIYLSLTLKRIKYSHEVYTSKPITVYGDINPIYLDIINEINAKRDSNKYNL